MYRSPNAYLDSHPHSVIKSSIRNLLIRHTHSYGPPPVSGHDLIRACIPDDVALAMDKIIAWNSCALHHDSNPDLVFSAIPVDRPWQVPANRSGNKFCIRVQMKNNTYRIGNRFDIRAESMEENDVFKEFGVWASGFQDIWYKSAAVYTYVVGALCATNTPGQLFNLWPTLTTFLDDETKTKLASRSRTSPVVRDVNKREFLEKFYTQEFRDKADQFLTIALLINSDNALHKADDFRMLNVEYFGESSHTFDNPPVLAVQHITSEVFSTF